MNEIRHICPIGKENPPPHIDKIALFKNRFDHIEAQDVPPMDLVVSIEMERNERRYHERFQLKEDAFALIRPPLARPLKIGGKSMGCIACDVYNSKSVRFGKIDNISMGGLMFHHVDCKNHYGNGHVLDILLTESRFYLTDIPYKTVADRVVPDEIPDEFIKLCQVRLEFQNLNDIQLATLKGFILNHNLKIGEIGD